jgi:hypothetical protein
VQSDGKFAPDRATRTRHKNPFPGERRTDSFIIDPDRLAA